MRGPALAPRPRATRQARQRERLLLRLLRDGPGRVLLVAALDLGADAHVVEDVAHAHFC